MALADLQKKQLEDDLLQRREINAEFSKIKQLASQSNPPPGIEEYQWVNFLKKAGLYIDPRKH